jgi:hypothetical protein
MINKLDDLSLGLGEGLINKVDWIIENIKPFRMQLNEEGRNPQVRMHITSRDVNENGEICDLRLNEFVLRVHGKEIFRNDDNENCSILLDNAKKSDY